MILEQQLKKIEHHLEEHFSTQNEKVSNKGVDWHIDHILRVFISIGKALAKSNPKDYKWRFSLIRTLIFLKGSIPRGKGKAPKRVTAQGPIKKEDILIKLKTTRELLKQIEKLPRKNHFVHPYFGPLHVKDSKKFLRLHTDHHLKIIDDIIAS